MSKVDEQSRPDPDALLARVKEEESRAKRGRLKIFFGASAGVGKTYAMLSEARGRAMEGADVVVGYAEPHARPETEELLLGMELLPTLAIEYRGAKLKEFDLEAALRRRPELLLVDELAHTNAPGMRHAKRWQDVEELLGAGVNVYTTLNVQHLESLNDVVAQITGVIVRETLPDAVFENADELELVDLPPDDLLERLREGKVYIPQQAEQAIRGFFRKPNLMALRELALRRVADRVGTQVLDVRDRQTAARTWPTSERLLVCITPSASSGRIIRAAKRMATSLRSEWIVAHVETPRFRDAPQSERDLLDRHFGLAERLGAETVTLSGLNPADEIVSYARERNATKIIVGKSDRPWWHDLFGRSPGDQLLRKSGDIDVCVIRGLGAHGDDEGRPRERGTTTEPPPSMAAWRGTAIVLLCCTAVALCMYYLLRLNVAGDLSNLVMVYLVGVVIVATRYGRMPSVVAALLSVAFFDFVFVPPRFQFAVADTQYLITFLVMLSVALVIGTLTVRVREQARASRDRERRTEALYRMIDQLASTSAVANLAETAVRHIVDVFHARVAILVPDEESRLVVRAASDNGIGRGEKGASVARWVFDHRQIAGRGTDTLHAADALYVPLEGSRSVMGVLAIDREPPGYLLAPAQRQLLDAFTNQIALALERDQLAQAARNALVQAETEKLRSSLLSSVSHDLRTPLAVITGASTSLLESNIGENARRELVQTIGDESQRLTRLVGNLLDITRLEAGAVSVKKEWQPLEEVVGSALRHLDRQLAGREVTASLPSNLPLLELDGVLIEQVLINLIENAVRYTPSRTAIRIAARAMPVEVIVEVSDEGEGLVPGEETLAFEKFYRGERSRGQRGAGLGLAICKAIITAHGGRIWAENRAAPDHGAVFRFSIPLTGAPPSVRAVSDA